LMKVVELFLHLFTPRHTNNFKARLLHASSISTLLTILLVFQIILTGLARFQPSVLGYATNISVTDLLKYTNEKRAAAGASTLTLNDRLSTAARAKAVDMFAKQYWAHTSPEGQDPWSFITTAGYSYLFAGENLARDFGDSRSVVEAWMNSPSHKENLLNTRYQEIGFAVVDGKFNGYETTLVVQMFAAKSAAAPTVETPLKQEQEQAAPTKVQPSTPSGVILNTKSNTTPPKFNTLDVTKKVSTGLIVVLLGTLLLDSFLVYRRRAVRISGHNLAHLLFLIAVLVAINFIGKVGVIL